MTKRRLVFILTVLTLLSFRCFGQDFYKQFITLCEKKDTAAQISLLKEWEKKSPNDPEMFVSYYNYYVQRSKQDFVGFEKSPKENSLRLKDSTGKTAGYLNGVVKYDDKLLEKGFEYIDKGILAFPNRLDMRFGKIYMLGQTENYGEFTAEIIKTIEYSRVNKNAWLWSENKPKKDPQKFMLGSLQDYVVLLYNTNDDALLDNIQQLSGTVLKYYPHHVQSLSNIALVYIINKKYDKALELLLKAETLAPDDYIVLNNIARAYSLKDDNTNAIKYYELVLLHGDDQSKRNAEKEIEKLKK